MGIPGLGDSTLPATLTTGIFRGGQSQVTHELSGIIKTREITQCCDDGDGPRELHATPCLQRLDHRIHTPRFDLVLEFVFETRQAFGVFVHCPDILLKDHLLSRGGTDDFAEPAEGGWAPGGPDGLANIVPQPQGFQTKFRGLEVTDGIFTRAAQVADGFVFHRRDIDGGEIT